MSNRALLAVLVALALARFALVACGADVFGYDEEFAKGAAAKALADGVLIPFPAIVYMPHEGGGFVVSILVALLGSLIGHSVLTVKLVALGWTVATAAAWLVFARTHLPRGTDAFLAVAFLFAPGSIVRLSLLALGTHGEAMLFVALVLHLGATLLSEERWTRARTLALGMCAGFGLYVSLQLLVPIALVAGALIVVRKERLFTSSGGFLALGLALGAAPLIFMLAASGSGAVNVRGQATLGGGPGPWSALASLVAPVWHQQHVLGHLHALLFVALVLVAWKRFGRVAHLLMIEVVLFTIAWTASGLALPYDPLSPGAWLDHLRLVPPWTVVTALASAAAALCWTRGGRSRWLTAGAWSVLVAAGVQDQGSILSRSAWRTPVSNTAGYARLRGYAYSEYFDKVAPRLAGDVRAKAQVLLAFHDDRELLVPAVAQSLFEHVTASDEEAILLLESAFGTHASVAALGLGRFWHTNWRYNVARGFQRIEAMPERFREPLAEALGRAGLGPRFRADRLRELLALAVPASHRAAWLRGLGWRIHYTFRQREDLAREFLSSCSSEQQMDLEVGFTAARSLDLGARAGR